MTGTGRGFANSNKLGFVILNPSKLKEWSLNSSTGNRLDGICSLLLLKLWSLFHPLDRLLVNHCLYQISYAYDTSTIKYPMFLLKHTMLLLQELCNTSPPRSQGTRSSYYMRLGSTVSNLHNLFFLSVFFIVAGSWCTSSQAFWHHCQSNQMNAIFICCFVSSGISNQQWVLRNA